MSTAVGAERRLEEARALEQRAHEPGGTHWLWRCHCGVLRPDRRPGSRCRKMGHGEPYRVEVVVAGPVMAALEFYGNRENYDQPKPFYKPFVEDDRGQIARAAIKGTQGHRV